MGEKSAAPPMPVSIAVVATHAETGNMKAYLVQYSGCSSAICASSITDAADGRLPRAEPLDVAVHRRHPSSRRPRRRRAEVDGLDRARVGATARGASPSRGTWSSRAHAHTKRRTVRDVESVNDDPRRPPCEKLRNFERFFVPSSVAKYESTFVPAYLRRRYDTKFAILTICLCTKKMIWDTSHGLKLKNGADNYFATEEGRLFC